MRSAQHLVRNVSIVFGTGKTGDLFEVAVEYIRSLSCVDVTILLALDARIADHSRRRSVELAVGTCPLEKNLSAASLIKVHSAYLSEPLLYDIRDEKIH